MQEDEQEDRFRMNTRQALEWAFGKELATLELPDKRSLEDRASRGFGMEYVLLQRAKLGGQIDTSIGRSYPHDDADTIAAVLSTLPPDLGGPSMARAISIMAKAGMAPDWRAEDKAKIEPRQWGRGTRHSGGKRYGKEEVCGVWFEPKRIPHPRWPGRWLSRPIRHDLKWVPITYVVHPRELEAARAEYALWWDCLDYVRYHLKHTFELTRLELTDFMPPRRPWITQDRLTRAAPSHHEAILSP